MTDAEEKRIRISFERWTEEDIELGEPSETGWDDEDGEQIEDVMEAVEFLTKQRTVEPSSSEFDANVWYRDSGPEETREFFEQGVRRSCSYHLSGFTAEEEQAIFNAVVKGVNPTLEDNFGTRIMDNAFTFALKVKMSPTYRNQEIAEVCDDLLKRSMNQPDVIRHAEPDDLLLRVYQKLDSLIPADEMPDAAKKARNALEEIIDRAEECELYEPDDEPDADPEPFVWGC